MSVLPFLFDPLFFNPKNGQKMGLIHTGKYGRIVTIFILLLNPNKNFDRCQ